MIAYVVDTNVALAANGKDTHADPNCQLDCINMLEDVCARQLVVLDDRYLIFDEYQKGLRFAGIPGAGDKFFKHVFDHMHGGSRVRQVPVTPCIDDRRGFEELPENELHQKDRKFLAAALVARADILNATDSDWDEQEELTSGLGVVVCQLCPQHASKTHGPLIGA